NKHKRCWLLLSENSFEEDFLYQTEWQSAIAENRLDRIDTVFIGRAERAAAINELLKLRQAELLDYLRSGAHLYLCGDRTVLTEVEAYIQQDIEMDWAALQKNGRIHRNLY